MKCSDVCDPAKAAAEDIRSRTAVESPFLLAAQPRFLADSLDAGDARLNAMICRFSLWAFTPQVARVRR